LRARRLSRGGMGDWALEGEEEGGREGFDTHLVTWSEGLTQFPDQALFPNTLVVLDLRYNKITRFPDDMGLLTNLQHLDLTRNRVEAIPDDISLWQNLRGLFMGSNRLAQLPSALGLVTSLQLLRLDHNQLVEVPWELGGLANLNVLGLEHNRITSLPPELACLRSLHLLALQGNPMIPPSGTRTRHAAPSAVNEPRSSSFLPDESEADRGHATGKPSLNRQAHDSLLAHMMSQLLYQDLSYRDLWCVCVCGRACLCLSVSSWLSSWRASTRTSTTTPSPVSSIPTRRWPPSARLRR